MSFSRLHKLKKVNEVVKKTKKYKFVIVGTGVYSAIAYIKLRNIYEKSDICFISESNISNEFLEELGPAGLRCNNVEIFKSLFPDTNISKNDLPSVFYKDQRFKSFGGRSKSEKLLFGEKFYTHPGSYVDVYKLLVNDSEKNFFDELIDHSFVNSVTAVKKVNNESELNWSIECINGQHMECEDLIWEDSPYQFYEQVSEKESLADSFIEFCESTKSPCSLFIKYIFDEKVSNNKETVFLPLSYTNEMGHFIGEFINSETKQTAKFVHFLDKDQSSEDDISRKMKNLKRSLAKIYSEFKKVKKKEYIVVSEKTPSFDMLDSAYKDEEAQNLRFIGKSSNLCKNYLESKGIYQKTSEILCDLRGIISIIKLIDELDS